MHLTIRRYRNVQGDRKALEDAVNREFVPLISKIDGFVDFYAFFSDDGILQSVSVFRDAKGAEESVRAAAAWVTEKMAKYVPEKPEVITGEVFAHRPSEKQKAA